MLAIQSGPQPQAGGLMTRRQILQAGGAGLFGMRLPRMLTAEVNDTAIKPRTRSVMWVIPAYDVNQGRVYLFKTAHHSRFQVDVRVPAVDVALATSAAPTYFPAHEIPWHGTYIDGGVWANAPVMVGVTEALDFLKQQPKDVRLLSISTTNYPFRISNSKRLGGILNWNSTIIETLMFGQAQGAIAMPKCLLREGLFHRIDFDAVPHFYSLDNAKLVEELIKLGRGVAVQKEHLDDVIRPVFLNGTPAEKFVPYAG